MKQIMNVCMATLFTLLFIGCQSDRVDESAGAANNASEWGTLNQQQQYGTANDVTRPLSITGSTTNNTALGTPLP